MNIPPDMELVDFSDLIPVDFSDLMEETDEATYTLLAGRQIPALPAAVQRLSHTHLAIMDYMLAHPNLHLKAVAKNFGYTQSWLSTLIHSDTFQKAWRERRKNWESLHDGRLSERLTSLANRGVEEMENLLAGEGDDAPTPRTVIEVSKLALTALGYTSGQKKEAAPPVAVQINVNEGDVALARQILARNLNGPVVVPQAD